MHQYVRSARLGDCNYLAPLLRAADLQEIEASSGLPPLDALITGFSGSSMAFTTLAGTGLPSGIGGVLGPSGGPGMIWYLATPEIEHTPITFLRVSREVVNRINGVWPVLYAMSDDRNTVHQRWLEWVGFTPVYRIPKWGVQDRPFTSYRKTLQHV